MNTIEVSNGDIKLKNGKISFVTGTNKLIQDLSRWLQEPLGTGFTTPNFGSTLYQYIGTTQADLSTSAIESEVYRVLQLYQGQQILDLQKAQNSATLSNWNKSEVIQSIVSINAYAQQSTVVVAVELNTLNNNLVNMNIIINNDGMTIQNG